MAAAETARCASITPEKSNSAYIPPPPAGAPIIAATFLAKRYYITSRYSHHNSVCRLTSVTLVNPTQRIDFLRSIMYHIVAVDKPSGSIVKKTALK